MRKVILILLLFVLTIPIFSKPLTGYIPQMVEVNRFEFYTNVPNVRFIVDFENQIIEIVKI